MLAERKLKKHVAIIHAYSLMTALQRKIVNVLLFEAGKTDQINVHDSVAVECRIPFSKVAKTVNFNSKNTTYLKEAIDGLASLKIEWNLLKDKISEEIVFLNLRVLHGAPTFYDDGTFNYSFHKIMLHLIKTPEIYGTVDLSTQALFESKYAHALYENSTRFANLHKNKVIKLSTFRQLLGVHPDKYSNMRELTRNVITPSIEEVNDHSDFVINLEKIRTGKKIEAFELSVQNKKPIHSVKALQENKNKSIIDMIKRDFGNVSVVIMKKILDNYSESYILEKIVYTKKHAKKDLKGFYPIPYFMSALKDDYKSNEKNNVELNCSTGSNNRLQWRVEYSHLINEIGRLKGFMEVSLKKKELERIKKLKGLIFACEEKLQAHLSKRPKQDVKEK